MNAMRIRVSSGNSRHSAEVFRARHDARIRVNAVVAERSRRFPQKEILDTDMDTQGSTLILGKRSRGRSFLGQIFFVSPKGPRSFLYIRHFLAFL